jgi:hypothetical protein
VLERNGGVRDKVNPLKELFDAAAQGYALRLVCRGCRRSRILNAHAVWYLFERRRWIDRLGDVPKRFRCADCGRKGPSVEPVHAEPDDHTLPLPPTSEWKRELRRRR